MKVHVQEFADGRHYRFYCPGCGHDHAFDARWAFDGDLESPTFTPSLLVNADRGEERELVRCHSFVTAGRIVYLDDCTHDLAGRTVEMEEVEA